MSSTAYSLLFDPLVPPVLVALLATALAVLLLPLVFNRTPGSLIRAGVGLLFCALLVNPSIQQESRETQSDIALVIVDESESQGVANRPALSEDVLARLTDVLEDQTDLDVKVIRTDGEAPGRDGTHLMPDLIRAQAAVAPNRLAGTFLLTDGQWHDPALASGKKTDLSGILHEDSPVHLMQIGAEDERDRRIVIREAPRFSIIGEPADISFVIEDTGDIPTRGPVTAVVRVDGQDFGRFQVQPGEPITISPEIERAGQTIVEISIPELPGGELTRHNNQSIVTINGIRQDLKVLLVTGAPHMGERNWRNLLKSDPSVELVHFTILRPPEKQDGTPSAELALIAFPTRELFVEKLHEFDLIIFDRYKLRGVLPLNYFQNIAQYVREGGALLVAAGPDFSSSLSVYRTPLGRILPGRPSGTVIKEAFRPALTEPGTIHPITSALAPDAGAVRTRNQEWGRWFRMVETELLAGDTLMDGHNGAPLLIVSRVGEGRVAQLNSDQSWLWTRGFEGGGPQTELLRRMAHWLMKEPELEEESLRLSLIEDTLEARLTTMSDQPDNLIIRFPDGTTRTEPLARGETTGPGEWVARIETKAAGIYRASVGTTIAVISKGAANPVEYIDLLPTDRMLSPVLDATGGGSFFTVQDGAVALPDLRQFTGQNERYAGPDWAALKRNNAFRVTGYTQVSLFPILAALVGLLGLLLLGWYRESR